MKKELVICIIIIIFIFIINIITQKYTSNSVETISSDLNGLKIKMKDENIETEKLKQDIDKLFSEWESKHDILAYYIEHDELEKVDIYLVRFT